MIAEQTVTCRYKATGQQEADVEIQMTVQLERRPADPRGDATVEIWKVFEPSFPEELLDEFYRRLDDAVHGAYAATNVPYIPDTTLAVKIFDISVLPSPQGFRDATDKGNLGYLLEVTVSGVVNTLCRGLENLRTGEEPY